MLIWGAMDFCLPGCRFCRLISTTCTLGLWRGGLELEVVGEVGKGKGLGVVVRTLGGGGGGGGEDGKDRVRCRDCLCF